MSNFLSIATVTATLGQVIQSAIDIDVPGAGYYGTSRCGGQWSDRVEGERFPVRGHHQRRLSQR